MTTAEQSLKVAENLTQAFAQLDAQGFEKLYAEDARIWHAATKQTQTKAENVGLLGAVFALMRQVCYEEISRYAIPEGFVQHHVIRGTFKDGTPVPELYAAMVVTVRDGQIVLLKEWFDAAQFGEVWKRLGVAL